jgi:hypothetical protein
MCFEAKKKWFPLFRYEAKITLLKRSEKWEAKRSEKIELIFLIEQAKHMRNGSNFTSFHIILFISEKKCKRNGRSLIRGFVSYTVKS